MLLTNQIQLVNETSRKLEREAYLQEMQDFTNLVQEERFQVALENFLQLSRKAENQGDLESFLEVSKPLLAATQSVPVGLWRQRAFSFLGRYCEAVSELEEILRHAPTSDEKNQILLALSHLYHWLSQYDRANHLARIVAKETAEAQSLIYIEALLELAFCSYESAPRKSIATLEKVKELLENIEEFPEYLWAKLYKYLGLTYYSLGSHASAALEFKKSQECYHKLGWIFDELNLAFNIISINYALGRNIPEALEQLKKIEEECAKLSFKQVRGNCIRLLANHLGNSGKFRESTEILSTVHEIDDRPLTNYYNVRYIKRIFWNAFDSGDWNEARLIIQKLVSTESIFRNPVDHFIFESINKCLSAFRNSPIDNSSTLSRALLLIAKDPLTNQPRHEELIIPLLELNFRSLFSIQPNEILKLLRAPSSVWTPFHQIQFLCLQGIHLFFAGRINSARDSLEASLKMAEQYEYLYWKARCLLGLSLISIREKNIRLAREQISLSEKLLQNTDSHFDKEFVIFLDGLIQRIDSGMKTCTRVWKKLPADSPFEKILLNGHSFLSHISVATNTTPIEIQLKKFRKSSDIPDLLLNENSLTLWVKGNSISLEKHSVLFKMLRFLLDRGSKLSLKKDLALFIWGEEYHSLIHGPRIYTSVMRINKTLRQELRQNVVLCKHGDYYINPTLRVVLIKSPRPIGALSERKNLILNFIEKKESISRAEIQKLMRRSKSLIKAELKELVEIGSVELVGKGKKCLYRLAQASN